MDADRSVVTLLPVKEDTKEVVDLAHEFDFYFGGELRFKVSFHFRIWGEVYEVVNKEASIDGCFARERSTNKQAAVMSDWS